MSINIYKPVQYLDLNIQGDCDSTTRSKNIGYQIQPLYFSPKHCTQVCRGYNTLLKKVRDKIKVVFGLFKILVGQFNFYYY